MKQQLIEIKRILKSKSLPTHDFLFELLQEFSTVLETEPEAYRPYINSNNENKAPVPGSLLDFQNENTPAIIIPDLHARPIFLLNILNYKLNINNENISVYSALAKNKLKIICVGDALHSECATGDRWICAQNEIDEGNFEGESIVSEMTEGFALLCGIMKLKILFPANFHFLKGNHENILNRTGSGDYSFRKYANEGHTVMEFVKHYYGEDILFLMNCVEDELPLIAVSKGVVVSHAEPKMVYSRQQLINARNEPGVVEGLTWTDNDMADGNSVSEIIKQLARNGSADDFVYLGGHRPVHEKYSLRQNGRYIQIHNPRMQNIAYVRGEGKFNPDLDILNVVEDKK